MRRLAIAAVLTAVAAAASAASGGSAAPASVPTLKCKYGTKVVTRVVRGHRKRVKVCKPKPKPKPKPQPKPKANLELTMNRTLEQVTVGNHVYYSIVVENRGPETAQGVVVSIDLPPGEAEAYGYGGTTEFADCNVEEGDGPHHLICNFGELGPETDADFEGLIPYVFVRVVLEPSQPGDYIASAKVASSTTDSHPEDDAASKPLHVLPGPASADLSVSISAAPDPASVPEGFTETVSVTNRGPSEATEVYVTVLIPQGASAGEPFPLDPEVLLVSAGSCPPFAYSFGSTSIVCFDFLGSGETRTQTIRIAPSIRSPSTLTTDAVVDSYTRDPNLADNRATSVAALSPFVPLAGIDLRLAFDQPPEFVAGKPVILGFRLANLGLGDIHEAAVEATMTPETPDLGLSLRSSDGSGTGCGSTQLPVTCPLREGLPSDARVTGALYAESVPPGSYTATVTVTSPDLSAPLTAATTFDVKPSQERR